MSDSRDLMTSADLLALAREHLEAEGKAPGDDPALQWTTPVTIVIKERNDTLRTLNAVVTSLSESDCSLICKAFIHPQSTALIQFSTLVGEPKCVARIARCELCEAGKHRLEAAFVDADRPGAGIVEAESASARDAA